MSSQVERASWHVAGIQVVKEGEEEAAEDDTNGLWNGQPFKPLPAVDVPDLPAGCARAMSLEVCYTPAQNPTGIQLLSTMPASIMHAFSVGLSCLILV